MWGTASTIARKSDHHPPAMFQGSIVALLTPFTEDGRIDFPAVRKLVDFHLEAGTDGLVIAGTTGESATLEPDEFDELLGVAIESVCRRIPVIAGTGSASTAHAIEQSVRAQRIGASAALVVTPYYNRPTQHGLVAHYRAVADAISIPLLMYNVPSRTSVDMQPETVQELSGHPGIAGVKEAYADAQRIRELVDRCGPEFLVLSGDDPTCLAAMREGARGVISVAANVAPRLLREMCDLAMQGEWESADATNERLSELYGIMALETNPIPVKWAAFEMGLIGPAIRLPLTALSASNRKAVRSCLERLEAVPAQV